MRYLGRYISRLLGRSLSFIISALLPQCIRDNSIAWWKDFNKIESILGSTNTSVLNFDGINDYVEFSGNPPGLVPGYTTSGILSFNAYFDYANFPNYENYITFIDPSNNDNFVMVYMRALNGYPYIQVMYVEAEDGGREFRFSTDYFNTNVTVSIDFNSHYSAPIVTINEDSPLLESATSRLINNSPDSTNVTWIGKYTSIADSLYASGSYIWDVSYESSWAVSGQPNGNLDSAWLDTIGSLDGTVYGSPTTIDMSIIDTTYYIEESIGKRTDTIYYGQYLDTTSGQIDFKRSSGTFDYTDPSDGSLVEGVSIPGNGLYTIPTNGICEIGVYPKVESISGLLNFDGINDFVNNNTGDPNVTGSKSITFKLYLDKENGYLEDVYGSPLINIHNALGSHDGFHIYLYGDELRIYIGRNAGTNYGGQFSLSGLSNQTLDCTVVKDVNNFISLTINGNTQSILGTSIAPSNWRFNIGNTATHFLSDAYVWDINIYDDPLGSNTLVHSWAGQPNGNLDSAWLDTIGGVNGTVFGSPTTTNIGTVGTISYSSFYPICETAGTVLHDTKGDSLHITVDSPVWSESLYGSDYLNQNGYFTKSESDALGYNWETDINGTPVILHDDTLVPFGDWAYELLYDSNGEIVYDSNSEPIYVKINL